MGSTLKPLDTTLTLICACLLTAACTKPNPDLILADADADADEAPSTDATSTDDGDDGSDDSDDSDATDAGDDGLDTGELLDVPACAATSEEFSGSCAACLAEACCEELSDCVGVEGCTCATACTIDPNTPTCLLECTLDEPPADSLALTTCASEFCTDACGLGAAATTMERLR